LLARGDRLYSALGGVVAKTSRVIRPSRSRWRSVCLPARTRLLMINGAS
jgi:hypothetical protein